MEVRKYHFGLTIPKTSAIRQIAASSRKWLKNGEKSHQNSHISTL
jgi:hypothetical protein